MQCTKGGIHASRQALAFRARTDAHEAFMSYRWLLRVHSGPQSANHLQQLSRALENLNPESTGRWTVQVATHRRVQEESHTQSDFRAARDLSQITFSGDAAVFLALRHEKQLITADQGISHLFNRIALYKLRSALLFEGSEYVLGDFTIRLCRTVLKPGEELKGSVVDVEYRAAADASSAHSALEEFISALHEGALEPLPDMLLVDADPQSFGVAHDNNMQHAALLYLACASILLQTRVQLQMQNQMATRVHIVAVVPLKFPRPTSRVGHN